MATFVAVLFLLAVAGLIFMRVRSWGWSAYGPLGGDDGRGADDDDWAGVREPRRPPPTSGAAAAVADPDDGVDSLPPGSR